MTSFKFGDIVTMKREGGTYMVVGPYIGERRPNDDQGPAVWVADIDTQYMLEMDGGTVWVAEDGLEIVDV